MPHPENVDAFGQALRQHGYEVTSDTVDGRPAVVGRRSDFRLRWMASRLHTFVVVSRFGPAGTDTGALDHFLDAACQYAVKNKEGLPRGLQTGTAAVAVAVMDQVDGDAAAWAGHHHGRRFAALTYPVAVETTTGLVIHPGPAVLGAIFNSHLRRVAEEIVAPAARP